MDAPAPKPITKTMQRRARAELRQKVVLEAERCGPLRGAALAIIDYAYSFAAPSDDITAPYFEEKTEWVFFPDPWIALKFTYQRTFAIQVSVGVVSLRDRADLPQKPGRYRGWTRFTIASPQQLPSAMLYLEEAYYEAESGYRKSYGKPKKKDA